MVSVDFKYFRKQLKQRNSRFIVISLYFVISVYHGQIDLLFGLQSFGTLSIVQ
jgi:hypothetical protein